MDVRLVEVPGAFELAEWRELLDLDPTRHIFATPEWNRIWWEEFGPGMRTFVLIFHDPHPVALAAFTVDDTGEGRRLRFLGGDDLTDYLGPVIAGAEHRPAVAEALLKYLRDEFDDWSYFDTKCLPVPFGFSEWLVEAADRLGMLSGLELHELTAVLALPGSFEDYMDGLSSKKRHELSRKMRRFDRELPGAGLRTSDRDSLENDLASFMDLHKGSEGPKGEFFLPRRASFFTRVALTMEPMGLLSLDFLELDERILAATFSFEFDGIFYLYNSAYDLDLKPVSPGLVLVAKLIERSIQQRMRRFDFLRGRERYKFDLGAEALPLHSVMIRPPG
ncbi:MAG TPA: GNAT family N-acetyltransferase [Actinomycetota bacterium]|nr:GNAT family N-acetyltransferase [Actinomycetota bacterium]